MGGAEGFCMDDCVAGVRWEFGLSGSVTSPGESCRGTGGDGGL